MCGRSYKNKQHMTRHMTSECGVQPKFRCKYCIKSFTRKQTLKIHLVQVHNRLPEEVQGNPCHRLDWTTDIWIIIIYTLQCRISDVLLTNVCKLFEKTIFFFYLLSIQHVVWYNGICCANSDVMHSLHVSHSTTYIRTRLGLTTYSSTSTPVA